MKEIETIRRLGYATSEEENRQGFFSAGAVVRDVSGRAVAVVSGAVPTGTLNDKDRTTIARQVLDAAQNASRKLGAPGGANHATGARRAATAKAR